MIDFGMLAFLAVKILVWLVCLLLCVAYMTYAERRVLGLIQVRKGPNRVGPFGLLQPLADGLKLMSKEINVPAGADRVLFRISPLMMMVPAFLVYAFIPLGRTLKITDVNAALLMILAVSSLGIYGIIIGGASSNSKYSTLGALRSAAQMISYEVSLALAVVSVVISSSSLNLTEIVAAQKGFPLIIKQPLAFIIFLIAGLAETNRVPFDLPEAESELVGGYHTEFSGMAFGMYFLGEYTNILTVSLLTAILFLGGWNGPWLPGLAWLLIKTGLVVFVFFWTRGTIPRFRYDQLMQFGWKVLLPLATLNIMLTGLLKVMVG